MGREVIDPCVVPREVLVNPQRPDRILSDAITPGSLFELAQAPQPTTDKQDSFGGEEP